MSGRKVEVCASWRVSSRHCVFQTMAEFKMTLATPPNSTNTGVGLKGPRAGSGQGMGAGAAKAEPQVEFIVGFTGAMPQLIPKALLVATGVKVGATSARLTIDSVATNLAPNLRMV